MLELDEGVDIISLGECHSVCVNSASGSLYFMGKIKSSQEVLVKQELPRKVEFHHFTKHGI